MSDPTPAPSAAPDDYADLRAAAEAATPGPWRVMYANEIWAGGQREVVSADLSDDDEPTASVHIREADAAFIAAANPATILRLLDELAAARAGAGEADAAVERESWAALQRRLFEECETAGWDPDKQNSFAEEIAHLHEEVSEAFREWRLRKDFEVRTDEYGKPTGIPIELADVLIGLFYNAELHGFSLMEAVETKHAYNLRRSYADEGRRLHAALGDRDRSEGSEQ